MNRVLIVSLIENYFSILQQKEKILLMFQSLLFLNILSYGYGTKFTEELYF